MRSEEITDALVAKAPWLRRTGYSDLRDDLVDDDDLLDAFVSSLAARAAAIGRTVPPHSGEKQRLAASEGWIHVPDERSLGELAEPRSGDTVAL